MYLYYHPCKPEFLPTYHKPTNTHIHRLSMHLIKRIGINLRLQYFTALYRNKSRGHSRKPSKVGVVGSIEAPALQKPSFKCWPVNRVCFHKNPKHPNLNNHQLLYVKMYVHASAVFTPNFAVYKQPLCIFVFTYIYCFRFTDAVRIVRRES